MNTEDLEHISKVREHITNVQRNCLKLADNLLKQHPDQERLFVGLIRASQVHDNSKFTGVEFKYLRPTVKESNKDLFFQALETHWANNDHHPEYHINGVSDMNDIQIAEMICDWKARSDEMGTSFIEWTKKDACDKYDINKKGRVWPKIKTFMELLLEEKFK